MKGLAIVAEWLPCRELGRNACGPLGVGMDVKFIIWGLRFRVKGKGFRV